MSLIKKLIPKLADTLDILKARQFVEINLASRAIVTNISKTYVRAFLELETEERGLADILVQVLQHDYQYDTVSYDPTTHRIIIEWDPRCR